MMKGAVLGVLEKYFSTLKTRSARNIGREKVICFNSCSIMVDGPRVLRAQKSLEIFKK
jgi:hypothetical protein